MTYDVDHFIRKFEAIPEEQWCIISLRKADGRRCALGQCGCDSYTELTPEAVALISLLGGNGNETEIVTNISDGALDFYKAGPTPKQRILAALREVKEKGL